MKSEAGQMTVEMTLMLVIVLAIATSISSIVSQKHFLATMLQGPQDFLTGMVENGVWGPTTKGKDMSPTAKFRHQTVQPRSP